MTARPDDEAALQRLLAEDETVAELGIDVTRRDRTVVLSGQVESAERRDEIGRRVAEYLTGDDIRNDIVVVPAPPPAGPEVLT
jgi:hypothetical protein